MSSDGNSSHMDESEGSSARFSRYQLIASSVAPMSQSIFSYSVRVFMNFSSVTVKGME